MKEEKIGDNRSASCLLNCYSPYGSNKEKRKFLLLARQQSGRIWVFNRSYSEWLDRTGGWRTREEVPAQNWIWYTGFGCGWWVSSRRGVAPLGRLGDLFVMQERGGWGLCNLNCRNAWCYWGWPLVTPWRWQLHPCWTGWWQDSKYRCCWGLTGL